MPWQGLEPGFEKISGSASSRTGALAREARGPFVGSEDIAPSRLCDGAGGRRVLGAAGRGQLRSLL